MNSIFIYKRDKVINVLIFTTVLLMLFMRPSLLQGYGNVILPMSLVLIILIGILKPFNSKISLNKTIYLFLVLVFSAFLLIQVFFSKDGLSTYVISSVLSIIIPSLLILIIDDNNWSIVIKAVIYPVVLLSISYLITSVLVIFGIDLNSLQIYNFYLDNNINAYHVVIYFPFSISLGYDLPGVGFRIARAIGYFREPGIFSPIVALCFFGIDFLKVRYKVVIKSLLILTLVLTFSTAGIVSFVVAFIYYFLVSKKTYTNRKFKPLYNLGVLIIFSPIIYLAFTDDFRFGLFSKLSQTSGQNRLAGITESIAILSDKPLLGVGYPNIEVSGVSFLSTLGQIGIVGGVLFLLIFFIPFVNKIKNRDPILALFIPLFIVSLLSQPLFTRSLLFLIATIVLCAPKNKLFTTI